MAFELLLIAITQTRIGSSQTVSFIVRRLGENRAAIILAGGDGMRLLALTRFIAGSEAPKQFCAVTGRRSLLEETRHRVARLIPINRTAIVLNHLHRGFYEPLVRDLPRQCLVEQARNRGTAPAILYGLRRLAHLGHEATVAIFPSDHFVGNDEHFMFHVEEAMRAVEESPSRTVILGMAALTAETSYGWIESSLAVSPSRPGLFRVRRFWEKPRLELAVKLWREGCLWNSFVIIGRSGRLQEIIAQHAPKVFTVFDSAFTSRSNENVDTLLGELYQTLPSVGFSEEILARCPSDLMVKHVDDVAWDDLGEPRRVLRTLRSIGHEPAWLKSFLLERNGDDFVSLHRQM